MSPLETLQGQVQVSLALAGDSCLHLFGARELGNNASWNRYIWVPKTGTPLANKITTTPVDQEREIGTTNELCDVLCVGRDYATAWAMRCNLLKAINDSAGVYARFVGSEWSRDAFLQDGQLLTVTIETRTATIDTYTPLDTLITPPAPTATITGVAVPTVELTNDLAIAGESLT